MELNLVNGRVPVLADPVGRHASDKSLADAFHGEWLCAYRRGLGYPDKILQQKVLRLAVKYQCAVER